MYDEGMNRTFWPKYWPALESIMSKKNPNHSSLIKNYYQEFLEYNWRSKEHLVKIQESLVIRSYADSIKIRQHAFKVLDTAPECFFPGNLIDIEELAKLINEWI